MMTFLLYKWFPVPEARLFALMLMKAHALYWRDAEGGQTESVHDLWTRLKDCEDQAAIESEARRGIPASAPTAASS